MNNHLINKVTSTLRQGSVQKTSVNFLGFTYKLKSKSNKIDIHIIL